MSSQQSTPFLCPVNVAGSGVVGPSVPTGYVILSGVSIAETAGTATRVELRDQGIATGNVVAVFQLAANGSTPLGDLPEVKVPGQIYAKVVGAGTLTGSIFIR